VPAFAEIGCVNALRGVGAFRVSESQLASAEIEQLWHSVQMSSVGLDARHAKAIEFAFDRPLAYWFGVHISTLGESNQISEHLLSQAIGLAARG